MDSIYQKALGQDFDRLHGQLKKKYGLTSNQQLMGLGQGRMTEVRGTNLFIRPFLQIGVKDHLVFSERGKNVPITIENYVFQDKQGKEKVSWIRRFYFPYAIRGFDATMFFDEEKGELVEELGKKGKFRTVLDLHVTKEGGLYMKSEGMTYNDRVELPTPTFEYYEHVDDQEGETTRIHMHISDPLLGTLLMYEGDVHDEFVPMTYSKIPDRGLLE